LELDANLTTLLCKKNIVAKSEKVKTGRSNIQEWTNLAESSEEGPGLKKGLFCQ
jgi:hypothetical protein